jgi:hypothetical protein
VEADPALLLGAAIAAPFNGHPSIIHPLVNVGYDKFVDQEIDLLIKAGSRKQRDQLIINNRAKMDVERIVRSMG